MRLSRYISILCLTGLLTGAQPFPSYGVEKQVGTAGYTFLKIPVSARQAALGETYISLENDGANAVFSNPALIPAVGQYGLSFSYANWWADMQHYAVSGVVNMGNYGALGIGIVRLDIGDIQGTVLNTGSDVSGFYIDTGSYTVGDYAVSLSYGKQLTDRFSFGVTMKYVREGFDNVTLADGTSRQISSSNILGEVGTLYKTGWRSLRIAAFVQNFGNDSRYERDDFQMPTNFRVGLGYDFFTAPASPIVVTFLAEAVHPTDYTERLSMGLEAVIMKSVVLRGGYQFNHDTREYSTGAGLNFTVGGFRSGLDIAYSQMEYLDDVIRFSLRLDVD